MLPVLACARAILRAAAAIPLAGIAIDEDDPALRLLTIRPAEHDAGDVWELAAQIAPVRDLARDLSHDAAAAVRRLEATATSQAISGGITPAIAAAVWRAQHRAAVLRKIDGTLSQTLNALRRAPGWQQVDDLRKAGGALAEALFFALEASDPGARPPDQRRCPPAA